MLAIFFASQLLANEVTQCVAVSADGSEITYLLANVQRIEVQANDVQGKMTILQKDGNKVGNYQKILFATSTTTSLEENKELFIDDLVNNFEDLEENIFYEKCQKIAGYFL